MTPIIPMRRRTDTNPEITLQAHVYTTRDLDGTRVVLRQGRGHNWHVCEGGEAVKILNGLDTEMFA